MTTTFNGFINKPLTIIESLKDLEGKTISFVVDNYWILTTDNCIAALEDWDGSIQFSKEVFETFNLITIYSNSYKYTEIAKLFSRLGILYEDKLKEYGESKVNKYSELQKKRDLDEYNRIKVKYNL